MKLERPFYLSIIFDLVPNLKYNCLKIQNLD